MDGPLNQIILSDDVPDSDWLPFLKGMLQKDRYFNAIIKPIISEHILKGGCCEVAMVSNCY